ncbi:MAG: rhodanese-like domain-containing protein [SAR324 cluster bacterium]|nr:rhodanese-like domain-containing protein [SAR324 cluster bacterium]
MWHDGGELAVLDVREEATFGEGHLFFASCLPLSRMELRIAELVPRRSVRVVLCDGGGRWAATAARRLAELGYTEVFVLDGGVPGWEAAGYSLYSGVNVPSKAFGEYVEARHRTPSISPKQLHGLLEREPKPLVLDSRPLEEFRNMSIPGGVNVPGADLVYRFHDLAPPPSTTVVVNCAGRTRSIVGAQSLINAGVPNPVVALRNGTMGWELAGYTLEHGRQRRAPEVSADGLAQVNRAAARVARRFGVRTVDRASLQAWREEGERRTLYLLDVRSPEEFEAGHLPGARPAPGGQLIQATDEVMATRGARVVLVDDTGVRAVMTASWLKQMGWDEVFVLESETERGGLEDGPHRAEALGLEAIAVDELAPEALSQALGEGAVVADLATSREYRRGHVPGARFAMRGRLKRHLEPLPTGGTLVLTSPDGRLARLAAAEAESAWDGPVQVLRGGTEGWREAGLPVEEGAEFMAGPPDDVYLKPYEHCEDPEGAMRRYLAWEIDLLGQVLRDGDARFRYTPPN